MPNFPSFERFFSLAEAITGDRLSAYASKFRVIDATDTTKKLAFDVSGVTTATTRTVTVPDVDATLGGPGLVTYSIVNDAFTVSLAGQSNGTDQSIDGSTAALNIDLSLYSQWRFRALVVEASDAGTSFDVKFVATEGDESSTSAVTGVALDMMSTGRVASDWLSVPTDYAGDVAFQFAIVADIVSGGATTTGKAVFWVDLR